MIGESRKKTATSLQRETEKTEDIGSQMGEVLWVL